MLGVFRHEPEHLKECRTRMFDALADYPVYEPPYHQGPNHPSSLLNKGKEEHFKSYRDFLAHGRENFTYFMEHRDARLAALGTFLEKFEVKMDVDDKGLDVVSAWCAENCGTLVADLRRDAVRQAFFQMSEPWTDWRRGFNVIFDIGVFLGECVITRNNRLNWQYRPGASYDGRTNYSGYGIVGFRNNRDWLDPVQYMYDACVDAEDDLRLGLVGRYLRADTLAGLVGDLSTR